MKLAYILLALVMALPCLAATTWSDYDATAPADNRRWDLGDDDIRLNWAALLDNLTITAGSIVIGNDANALQSTGTGAITEILVGGGTGTIPVWTTATGGGAPVRTNAPDVNDPNLTFTGQTAGDTFYFNGSTWGRFAIGTAGQHFVVNAGATAAAWTADPYKKSFNMQDPNSVYTRDTQFCIDPNTSGAVTISEIQISLDADPTTELDWNLKFADAFIGLANATLIVACDTTTGTADVDSGFNDATVPAGKCIYFEFDAQPDPNTTQAIVKVLGDYD